ncbi:hypothetical protein FO520_24350, partial [Bacillus subtilis]
KKETPAKEEKEPETVAIETKETPAVTKPISAVTAEQDDFEHRATVIDEVLEGNNDHLSIWKRVQRTDARFTKPLEGMGFTGTSINSTYMFMGMHDNPG